MKKKIILVAIPMVTFFSYSQELTLLKTDPNGVNVYKAIDVETTLGEKKVEFKTNPPHVLTDFSFDELRDILNTINAKIKFIEETGENSESLDGYVEQRQVIRKRIQLLKS
jgi:hypothetical protein